MGHRERLRRAWPPAWTRTPKQSWAERSGLRLRRHCDAAPASRAPEAPRLWRLCRRTGRPQPHGDSTTRRGAAEKRELVPTHAGRCHRGCEHRQEQWTPEAEAPPTTSTARRRFAHLPTSPVVNVSSPNTPGPRTCSRSTTAPDSPAARRGSEAGAPDRVMPLCQDRVRSGRRGHRRRRRAERRNWAFMLWLTTPITTWVRAALRRSPAAPRARSGVPGTPPRRRTDPHRDGRILPGDALAHDRRGRRLVEAFRLHLEGPSRPGVPRALPARLRNTDHELTSADLSADPRLDDYALKDVNHVKDEPGTRLRHGRIRQRHERVRRGTGLPSFLMSVRWLESLTPLIARHGIRRRARRPGLCRPRRTC